MVVTKVSDEDLSYGGNADGPLDLPDPDLPHLRLVLLSGKILLNRLNYQSKGAIVKSLE